MVKKNFVSERIELIPDAMRRGLSRQAPDEEVGGSSKIERRKFFNLWRVAGISITQPLCTCTSGTIKVQSTVIYSKNFAFV